MNRDGASSGKTSESFSNAASGSSLRNTRSTTTSTPVASALSPSHQTRKSTSEPVGAGTTWLAKWTNTIDPASGAT